MESHISPALVAVAASLDAAAAPLAARVRAINLSDGAFPLSWFLFSVNHGNRYRIALLAAIWPCARRNPISEISRRLGDIR